MPDFLAAFNRTMDFEGRVLENDPNDPGGETFWGISRVNHPNWPGWALIDANPGNLPMNSLQPLVEQFYLNDFWNVAQCGLYQSQELANQVFDAFVNLGIKALKILQNIVGVTDDGVIGPATMAAINAQQQHYLAGNYIAAREAYYKQLVVNNPNLARYLNGWLNRCEFSSNATT